MGSWEAILAEAGYAKTQANAVEFVRRCVGHQHMVLVYKEKRSLDTILSAFFDATVSPAPKGLQSVDPTNLPHVTNMIYNELLSMPKPAAMQKLSEWIAELHSSNKSGMATRIGGEDTWFLENGFAEEILALERAISKRIQDNISILCTYDSAKVSERHIKTLIESHSYVILDEPFRVYAPPGVGINLPGSEDLDRLLLESIDEVLAATLGSAVREAIYLRLERGGLKRDQIPARLDDFTSALEGPAAFKVIERAIAKRFYSKLGFQFERIGEYGLADYVNRARTKHQQGRKGVRPQN